MYVAERLCEFNEHGETEGFDVSAYAAHTFLCDRENIKKERHDNP